MFDLYGGYIRHIGGEIAVRSLVRLAECFDVSEDTLRVTLSRMRREGWLDSRREGRLSWYRLTDKSWRLLDAGLDRILNRGAPEWNGEWHLVIYQVPETERSVRDRLRTTLEWLGFGPLAPSTWISPHDRTVQLREALDDRGISTPIDEFTAQTGSLERDRRLVARCWDLDTIQRAYTEFIATYEPQLAAWLDDSSDGQDAFVERVRLINSYRKLPFLDPDLPDELLPASWAGRHAHEIFLTGYDALEASAFAWFRSIAEQD